jgi:hypothetical protein
VSDLPDAEPAGSLAWADDDILARNEGWLLMLLGVALVALATIFRASAAVAGPFATLGPLCVLGVLVHRAEGLVKFGQVALK